MNSYDPHFESEYNLRARHPDFETYFARWQEESDKARRDLPCNLSLPYGNGPNMTLDIFPQSQGLNPVCLFIHGGYWRAMDKELFSYPAIGLNEAGVVFISINYALAPTISLDGIVEQCREAVLWVHRNAEAYGGDPTRIHISGHSAGGHLTAMMLSTNWSERGATDIKLAGGIAISGMFDLVPLIKTSINDDINLDREAALRNSPITFLPKDCPPLIAAVGAGETDEFLRQSREYTEAWNDKDGHAQYLPVPSLHHFDVILELGRSGSELNDAALAQMGV
ncbi:MAG: esterase [Rhodospirillaceae bacterium]|nr:esterase [Rhodospirillaceae bacterium]